MTDQSFSPVEGDVPVNPYSLLEAVNATSAESRRSAFAFVASVTYLWLAVAGVGHEELLLARDVQLPLIDVGLDLRRFFLWAPLVLCVLHFAVLLQHALLARKVLEFAHALRTLESTEAPRHPLRLELHSYFFTQALAGPERSSLLSFFLHLQGWLTLMVLPVGLLVLMQMTFLPYHDIDITWAQRIMLLIDIAIILAIGIFLTRSDVTYLGAVGRTLVHRPVMTILTAGLLSGTILFSFLAVTVPGEALERISPRVPASIRWALAATFPLLRDPYADTAFGFRRNLVVMDTDLSGGANATAGRVRLTLRGRDLRDARLDRSDLHQADLTGATLDGASLAGADIEGAALGCRDLAEVRSGNRGAAGCTSLKGADLVGIRAAGAQFDGADLAGANLTGARIERAEFTAAALQGANLLQAQAQGANFFGAGLQGADLTSAGLQGASFRNALLQGAHFGEADLEGADLSTARLTGARLAGARLTGADLQGARIWLTTSPGREALELADLLDLRIRPPEESESNGLKSMLAQLTDPILRSRVAEALAPVLDPATAERWRGTTEASAWQSQATSHGRGDGEPYRAQLTAFLGSLACKPRWSTASVAAGLSLRLAAPRFKGNAEALYARLTSPDCAASRSMPAKALMEMSAAIDGQKSVSATITTLSARGNSDAPGGALSVPIPVPANAGRDR